MKPPTFKPITDENKEEAIECLACAAQAFRLIAQETAKAKPQWFADTFIADESQLDTLQQFSDMVSEWCDYLEIR